jgi:alpha-glucosidase
LAFRNGTVTVIANVGADELPLPAGEVLLSSEPGIVDVLAPDTTAWLRVS